MAVNASFFPERTAVPNDRPASLSLRLANDTADQRNVRLATVGDLAKSTAVQLEEVHLGAGQVVDVPVSFDAQRPLRAGSYTCEIAIMSDDGANSVARATLDVDAVAACAVSLIPERSRSATVGRHRLLIENQGNVAVNVDVHASMVTATPVGPDDRGSPAEAAVALSTPAVIVDPERPGRIDVRVRPSSTFWTGPPRLHDFVVDASASSGQTFQLVGQYEQAPRIRPWAVPAAVGAISALLLGTLAWFTLLRPSVEDIADDAARQAAEVNRVVIDDKLIELDRAAEEAARLPLGTPIDVRLSVAPAPGQTAQDSAPIEQGTVVSVTDVVLQNPGGALGRATLRRGSEVLLESELANFRDLDFHFVAPFRFDGGSSISLEVTCETPGPASDTCDVGATAIGFSDDS